MREPMADRFLVLPFIGRSRIVDLFFRKGDEEGESAAEALAAPFPQDTLDLPTHVLTAFSDRGADRVWQLGGESWITKQIKNSIW